VKGRLQPVHPSAGWTPRHMNDPIAAGVILSAAFLLVYAAWNAPVLRWAAICLALGMLVWAVTEAIPLAAQERSPLHLSSSTLA